MHFIIQENIFREQHYDLLITTLDRLNLPYTIVRVFPFIDKVVDIKNIPEDNNFNVEELPDLETVVDKTNKVDTSVCTNNIFIFGSVKLARIMSDKGYYPGSLYNDNHDYLVYSEYYKDNLLNYDSKIIDITDKLEWLPNEEKFFRPCKDTKVFTGKVFTQIEWEEFTESSLHNDHDRIMEAKIQCSTIKNIQKEIRYWIVDGEVVTNSLYKLGSMVQYDEFHDEDALQFVKDMISIYKPATSFVIDICQVDNKWKIVEINCINCAGFYKSNIGKLLEKVYIKYNLN